MSATPLLGWLGAARLAVYVVRRSVFLEGRWVPPKLPVLMSATYFVFR
jgi:hypothetical protein